MREPQINKRLLAAAGLVRRGAALADIGTDHGYLPIYLILCGKIERAILSDINEGPLESAKANAALSGVSQYVEFHLADGASELANSGATDYAVLGMGGELIAKIIDEAPHLKSEAVNLILQPMTRPEALRKYLFDGGFSILREVYCRDAGKCYVIINAQYSVNRVAYTEADISFGTEEAFFAAVSPEMQEYMTVARQRLKKIIDGKLSGGESCEREIALIEALKERLKKI